MKKNKSLWQIVLYPITNNVMLWVNPLATAASLITNKTTGNAAKWLWDKYVDPVVKQIQKLQEDNAKILQWIKDRHGDTAVAWAQKPTTDYDYRDTQIARMNPSLYEMSKQFDLNKLKMQQLENEKTNIEKAQNMMFGALWAQKDAINAATDARLGSIAQQKDIQKWAVQWMAWAAWAPSGMMSKIQSEIAAQYAPQVSDIEAARQQGLAGVYGAVANIPWQLAWLQAQNLQNEQARQTMDYYKSLQNKSKSWGSSTYNMATNMLNK